MAAGVVYHNFTLSPGVISSVGTWAPNTAAPDVANLPAHMLLDTSGAPVGNAVVNNASAAAGGVSSTARLASSAATTNAINVKTSAGRVYQMIGRNNAAYPVYLVLYDSASNPPVPGTTTIRNKIHIPPGVFVFDFGPGKSFATGIGFAFTKLVADSDTTAIAAGDVEAFNVEYV